MNDKKSFQESVDRFNKITQKLIDGIKEDARRQSLQEVYAKLPPTDPRVEAKAVVYHLQRLLCSIRYTFLNFFQSPE